METTACIINPTVTALFCSKSFVHLQSRSKQKHSMADDFERAVICLFDDSASQQIKQSAQQYCTQLQQRNDIWKLCMERLLKAESRQEVKFWSLQTLSTFLTSRFRFM